jgi:hypothetical protein
MMPQSEHANKSQYLLLLAGDVPRVDRLRGRWRSSFLSSRSLDHQRVRLPYMVLANEYADRLQGSLWGLRLFWVDWWLYSEYFQTKDNYVRSLAPP